MFPHSLINMSYISHEGQPKGFDNYIHHSRDKYHLKSYSVGLIQLN